MKTFRWALILALSIPAAAAAQEPPARPAKPMAAKAPMNPAAEAAYADIKATLGSVPSFLKAYPAKAIAGAWEEMKGIQFNPKTALPPKDKELIGLAVAAQIPCTYCIYFHKKSAKLAGATDDEVAEAVAMAAATRHWSAIIHGYQFDMAAVQAMDQAMQAAEKRAKEGGAPPPAAAVPVTDAASAKADMMTMFGVVPDFIHKFPPEGLAGAWKSAKDLDFAADGALTPKLKMLISVAVGSQIPCDRCLAMDIPGATRAGATQAELSEAVAMAAITRLWSTILNGSEQDLAAFRKEVDRAFAFVTKAAAAAK